MEIEHEKGPWKITSMSGGCARIGTDKTHTIAVIGGLGQAEATANASRIVMCINACEGLSLVEVREVVRKLKIQRKWVDRKKGTDEHHFSCRGTRAPGPHRAEA